MPSSISISKPLAGVALQRPRHVEQVVAGDADANGAGPLRPQGRVEQALVAGIRLRLGGVRRRHPAVLLGIDQLHRQVGPLDDAHLDRRPTRRHPPRRPRAQPFQHGVGVRQVGLHDDPGHGALERRLVEHAAEGHLGEVDVGVLLHVEVDEHRRFSGARSGEHPAQLDHDPLDAVLERDDVELGAQRRDLDRDVVDVGSFDERDHPLHPLRGLVVAEDRLAEQVDVQVDAVAAPRRDVPAERRVLRRDDQPTRLGDDAPAHQRHDQVRDRVAPVPAPARSIARSIASERSRDRLPGHEPAEPSCRGGIVVDPQHLVGQPLDELTRRRVVDDPPEATLPPAFGGRRPGERGAQQACGTALCAARPQAAAGDSTRSMLPRFSRWSHPTLSALADSVARCFVAPSRRRARRPPPPCCMWERLVVGRHDRRLDAELHAGGQHADEHRRQAGGQAADVHSDVTADHREHAGRRTAGRGRRHRRRRLRRGPLGRWHRVRQQLRPRCSRTRSSSVRAA